MTGPAAVSATLARLIVALALIAPWLLPPQGAPSPAVWPWLFSLACAAVLLAVHGAHRLRISAVPAGWLAAALISSVIGLCQYFGVEHLFAPWMSPGGDAPYANLRQRNQFATLTNMGLAALLWLALQPPMRVPQRRLARSGLLAAAVLLAAANAASASRTGLLQLCLIWVLAWLWGGLRLPELRRLLLVASAAYLAATVILPMLTPASAAGVPVVWSRLSQGDAVCGSRWTLWGNVLQLIAAQPWTGWGWGELDYAHFMTLYPGERFCEILDNAHNLPLHLAVELGIPAASVLLGGLLWGLWRARPWRETDATRQVAWTVLALIGLHSLVEYPLWFGPFQLALALCVWLLWPRPAGTAVPPAARQNTVNASWTMVLGGSLMLAVLYAAWDYHRVSQIYLPPERRAAGYRTQTLEKVRSSWLFRNQVAFADYTLAPLTTEHAQHLYGLGRQLLHYSPEARVVEKLIASATLLGKVKEVEDLSRRYRAAYPQDYARWSAQRLESGRSD